MIAHLFLTFVKQRDKTWRNICNFVQNMAERSEPQTTGGEMTWETHGRIDTEIPPWSAGSTKGVGINLLWHLWWLLECRNAGLTSTHFLEKKDSTQISIHSGSWSQEGNPCKNIQKKSLQWCVPTPVPRHQCSFPGLFIRQCKWKGGQCCNVCRAKDSQ